VFAWAQNRSGLTAWYGVGTALQRALQQHGREALAEMARDWPFFDTLVERRGDGAGEVGPGHLRALLAARERVRADGGRRRPACVLPSRHRRGIRTRALGGFRDQGHRRTAGRRPRLRQSIRLRNPYVDPISMLQVDLLARWRAQGSEDEALLQSLMATVNGIAAGIQNTG
jgi:phosphoenolpyruvate carboxylase